jgi:hypothetical protein
MSLLRLELDAREANLAAREQAADQKLAKAIELEHITAVKLEATQARTAMLDAKEQELAILGLVAVAMVALLLSDEPWRARAAHGG